MREVRDKLGSVIGDDIVGESMQVNHIVAEWSME